MMRKNFKKIHWLGSFLILFVFLLALPLQANAAKASIKLNASKKSITVGNEVTLKATVTGKSSQVTWKSSKKSVATVSSSGVVTAKKAGKTTITAKANGKTAKCVVTVKKAKKIDMLSYMKKNIDQTAKKLGCLEEIERSDYIWLRGNGFELSTYGKKFRATTKIYHIRLYGTTKRNANYTVAGVQPGMKVSEAKKILKKAGWKSYPNNGDISLIYKKSGKMMYVDITSRTTSGTVKGITVYL